MAIIGKLKKMKDELGNYFFPVTSTKAVFMEDGSTILNEYFKNGDINLPNGKSIKGDLGKGLSFASGGETILSSQKQGEWMYFRPNGSDSTDSQVIIKDTGEISINNSYSNNIECQLFPGTVNGLGVDPTMTIGCRNTNTGATTLLEIAQPNNLSLERTGEGYFGPIINCKTNLGTDVCRWKDIWVGYMKHATFGFSTSANGFLQQWGRNTLTFSNANHSQLSVNFPIKFPSNTLVSMNFFVIGTSFGWGHSSFIIQPGGWSDTSFSISVRTFNNASVTGDVQIGWSITSWSSY